MIFYTLRGPFYLAEVQDDKIILKKRLWFKIISGPGKTRIWKLSELCQFNLSSPSFLLPGKISWRTFDGDGGSFRYTTNSTMMKKIGLYLQKKIIKNHQVRFMAQNSQERIQNNSQEMTSSLAA